MGRSYSFEMLRVKVKLINLAQKHGQLYGEEVSGFRFCFVLLIKVFMIMLMSFYY